MILSKAEILKAVREKRIVITPFSPKNVGPCSVDFSLGNEFRVFDGAVLGPLHAFDEKLLGKELERRTRVVRLGGGDFLNVAPGELVLGVTKERLRLSKDLMGKLEGRSRFARIGLFVHVSASLIQPGVDNVQVLEIFNASPYEIRLRPGMRVCQVVFSELRGEAEYSGEYKKQLRV